MLSGWWPGRGAVVLAAIGMLVTLALGVMAVATGHHAPGFDVDPLAALYDWASADPARWRTWLSVTAFGEWHVLVWLYAIVVLACLLRRRYAAALVAALSGATYSGVSHLLKVIVDRPRPDHPSVEELVASASFPSGHTGGAMCLATVAFLVFGMALPGWWRVVGAAVFVIPVLVGLSRMMLGVHFPTDVIGGLGVGAVWPIVIALLVGRAMPGWPRRGGGM